jgi:hypothetical protein
MQSNSKDGFQLLPQHVDQTCETNAKLRRRRSYPDPPAPRSHTMERSLFRSKCHPDDIPDVARDVTWYDSFYENDADVIAAFDMNHKMLDRNAMFCYCRMFGISIFCIVPFLFGILVHCLFGYFLC